MIRKPAACQGCPFHARSTYMVPDEVVEGAPVYVYGQNPGREEEAAGKPYIGKTGGMMEANFFPLAQLQRGGVSIGNAIRCRLDGGNSLPPLESREVRDAIVHCTQAYLRPPATTRLVVTQGEYALWATTGFGLGEGNGVTEWRGWLLPFRPAPEPTPYLTSIWMPRSNEVSVLASYHLAYLFRNPKEKVATQRDWCKVPLVMAGTWPRPLPPISADPPVVRAPEFTFDSEWDMGDGRLICWSLYDGGSFVYVVYAPGLLGPIQHPKVIFHNAQADLDNFEAVSGLGWGQYDVEDTMYAHAALWGGFPHDLEFPGSLYASINRWKHLQHTNPREYSAGDAVGTWDVWLALQREFRREPPSEQVYRGWQLPLIPIIRRAKQSGLRLHQERVPQFLQDLDAMRGEQQMRAQAAVGWPLNLGSGPQVGYQLYDVEGLSAPRKGWQPGRRPRKRMG